MKIGIINTNFEFTISACHLNLGSYIYHFVRWICELPDTYDAINEKKDFHWNFLEQSYTPVFWFEYKDDSYSITLSDSTLGSVNGWQEEIISIEDLKKEIDSARQKYYDFVKQNLGDVLPDYLELLDLNFKN